MPGPVSDSYDPEWSTSSNREDIETALSEMHEHLGTILKTPPKYILDVVHMENGPKTTLTLTERQLRILRFACERAGQSL